MVASDIDMLVVGSGPVGLAAAIEARRLGLSHRIVERKERRRDNDSRAVVVHPRILELLETTPGVVRRISERAETLPRMNLEFIDDKKKTSILDEEQRFGDTDYKHLYFLPQYLTEKSLEEEVDKGGGKVEYGITFETLAQTPSTPEAQRVTATVSRADGGTEEITAKYVIGADGGRSKVRDSVGIALHRTRSSVYFALGDMKITENSPDKKLPGAHIMLTGDGPCAMLPLGRDDQLRLLLQVPDGLAELDKDFFEKRILAMTGKHMEVELGEWQSIFEITHGVSEAYRRGRVFLAGDAAHVHSPVGGQGMNYGIWDSVTLVSKIAWAERVLEEHPEATAAAESILTSYADERHAMGEELIANVKFATHIVTTRHRLPQKIRNAAMRRLLPLVKRDLWRKAGQLDLAYQPSYSCFIVPAPRSWFRSKSFIGAPGHRVPNIVLEDGSKLYKHIDRVRYTWICINLTLPPATQEHCICIKPAKAAQQTSVPAILEETLAKPQAILVRPDLFVAAVDDSFEELEVAVKNTFGVECYAAM